jgi:hypothetical protein
LAVEDKGAEDGKYDGDDGSPTDHGQCHDPKAPLIGMITSARSEKISAAQQIGSVSADIHITTLRPMP